MDMNNEKARQIVIDLAEKLGVNLSAECCRSCENCYYYEHGDDMYQHSYEHCCYHPSKCTIFPPEPDDMSHQDITEPGKILTLSEAIKCPLYLSGKEQYKEELRKEHKKFEEFKDSIRELCR